MLSSQEPDGNPREDRHYHDADHHRQHLTPDRLNSFGGIHRSDGAGGIIA
jgi:hypothetical protein